MNTSCPHCQEVFEVDHQYVGKTTKCPGCDNEFVIVNPNLQPCPDCFATISKRAQCCPRCGAVLQTALAVRHGKTEDSPSDEKPLLELNTSAVNYLWVIILGIVTIPFFIGIFILLYAYINTKYTSYRITNRRMIASVGFLAKTQREIWIEDMRGVTLVQSIFQRMVGIGTVEIGTAATAGVEMRLIGIRHPQKVVDLINAQRKK